MPSDESSFEVVLCDMVPLLVRAWRVAFAAFPEVTILCGDLLEVEVDAYVSPANSYGIMDGGIDAALSVRFPEVALNVRAAIGQLGGKLPVGQALVVETGDAEVPYMVCAPTMELPSRVGHTSNAYQAMRALLNAVERFNGARDSSCEDLIQSIAVPGLCTGVGDMEPEIAALQMARAYAEWRERSSI